MWPNRLLAGCLCLAGLLSSGPGPAPHCPCSALAQRAGMQAVVFAQGVTHSEFRSSCLIVAGGQQSGFQSPILPIINHVILHQCFLIRADFDPLTPRDHLATSTDIFDCQKYKMLLLASSGQRPEMLLSVLQGAVQPLMPTGYPAQGVRGAEAERASGLQLPAYTFLRSCEVTEPNGTAVVFLISPSPQV